MTKKKYIINFDKLKETLEADSLEDAEKKVLDMIDIHEIDDRGDIID